MGGGYVPKPPIPETVRVEEELKRIEHERQQKGRK
jgi:hypothetical protein